MFTALATLLGSAAVRLALGYAFEFITKWFDQRSEMERLRLQGELDAQAHVRQTDMIRLQAELGVKTIQAQSAAHVTNAEADAFVEAVKSVGQRTGILFVDAWNGIIRPFLATVAIALWVSSLHKNGWVPTPWDRDLMAAVLGVFIGGRIHATGR